VSRERMQRASRRRQALLLLLFCRFAVGYRLYWSEAAAGHVLRLPLRDWTLWCLQQYKLAPCFVQKWHGRWNPRRPLRCLLASVAALAALLALLAALGDVLAANVVGVGTIAFIRQSTGSWSSGSSFSVTLSGPPSAGNQLMVQGGGSSGGGPFFNGVSGGGTWNNAQAQRYNNNDSFPMYLMTIGTADGTTGPVVIAISGGTVNGAAAVISEWVGISETFDQYQATPEGGSAQGTTLDCQSVTVSNPYEVLFSVAVYAGSATQSSGPSSGWTEVQDFATGSDPCHIFTAYQIVTSAGTYDNQYTISSSSFYSAATITYQGALVPMGWEPPLPATAMLKSRPALVEATGPQQWPELVRPASGWRQPELAFPLRNRLGKPEAPLWPLRVQQPTAPPVIWWPPNEPVRTMIGKFLGSPASWADIWNVSSGAVLHVIRTILGIGR